MTMKLVRVYSHQCFLIRSTEVSGLNDQTRRPNYQLCHNLLLKISHTPYIYAGFGEIVVSEMNTLVTEDIVGSQKHGLGNADTLWVKLTLSVNFKLC